MRGKALHPSCTSSRARLLISERRTNFGCQHGARKDDGRLASHEEPRLRQEEEGKRPRASFLAVGRGRLVSCHMKHRSCVKKKKKKGIICKPKDGRPRSTAPVGPERKKAKPASKRSGARTEAEPAEVEMEAVAPVAATIAAGEAAAGEVAAADDLCPEPPAAAEPQSKPAELKRAKRKEVANPKP